MYSKSEQTKSTPKKKKKKNELPIPQLKKKVQRAVNAYVRLRDKDLPCVSCHRRVDNKDAGHYLPMGSNGSLRYHLWNLAGQCTSCNRFRHGNLIEFRFGLIARIGQKEVEWLEEHRHTTKKWRKEELENILLDIKEKTKKLPIA